MKLISRLLVCGLVLGFAIPFAQAQHPQEKPYFCRFLGTTPGAPHATRYLSNVSYFRTSEEFGYIQDAWNVYIWKTYRLLPDDGHGDCAEMSTNQVQQQFTLRTIEQSSKAVNEEVVHIDWKYTGEVPELPQNWNFCHSGGAVKSVDYFSDISVIPDADTAGDPVPVTFVQFLRQKYSYPAGSGVGNEWQRAGAGCFRRGSKLEEEIIKERLEAKTKLEKRQVVETGWKYARTPDTPPPARRISH